MFIASHGSWNRTVPSGYLINYVPVNADGTAGAAEIFTDGFIDKETKRAFGRPVDVVNLPDGSILVSDDYAGALYSISYTDNAGAARSVGNSGVAKKAAAVQQPRKRNAVPQH